MEGTDGVGGGQGRVVKALFESGGAPCDWPPSTPVWWWCSSGRVGGREEEPAASPVPIPRHRSSFARFGGGSYHRGRSLRAGGREGRREVRQNGESKLVKRKGKKKEEEIIKKKKRKKILSNEWRVRGPLPRQGPSGEVFLARHAGGGSRTHAVPDKVHRPLSRAPQPAPQPAPGPSPGPARCARCRRGAGAARRPAAGSAKSPETPRESPVRVRPLGSGDAGGVGGPEWPGGAAVAGGDGRSPWASGCPRCPAPVHCPGERSRRHSLGLLWELVRFAQAWGYYVLFLSFFLKAVLNGSFLKTYCNLLLPCFTHTRTEKFSFSFSLADLGKINPPPLTSICRRFRVNKEHTIIALKRENGHCFQSMHYFPLL